MKLNCVADFQRRFKGRIGYLSRNSNFLVRSSIPINKTDTVLKAENGCLIDSPYSCKDLLRKQVVNGPLKKCLDEVLQSRVVETVQDGRKTAHRCGLERKLTRQKACLIKLVPTVDQDGFTDGNPYMARSNRSAGRSSKLANRERLEDKFTLPLLEKRIFHMPIHRNGRNLPNSTKSRLTPVSIKGKSFIDTFRKRECRLYNFT